MAVLLLALLPVPPKLSKSTKADQYQRQVNTAHCRTYSNSFLRPCRMRRLMASRLIVPTGRFRGAFPSCLHGLLTI